jgi:hypothetical protein
VKAIQFLVTVEVSRTEGKFASREELIEMCKESIEQADPGSLSGENGGEYNVDTWTVDEYVEPKVPHGKKRAR